MTEQSSLPNADRWLAAEYALGALDGADRRRAAARYDNDASFREAVDHWHNQFAPMLDAVEEVEAPDRVWTAIGREIGFAGDAGAAKPGLWSNLGFWRGLSFVSLALAVLALSALIYGAGPQFRQPAPLVATLNASGAGPVFTVRYDPQAGSMVVTAAKLDGADERVPELWLIPGDGVPRSLGVLASGEVARVTVPEPYLTEIREGAGLAITLEPAGGSPTGKATGPVVASGALFAL